MFEWKKKRLLIHFLRFSERGHTSGYGHVYAGKCRPSPSGNIFFQPPSMYPLWYSGTQSFPLPFPALNPQATLLVRIYLTFISNEVRINPSYSRHSTLVPFDTLPPNAPLVNPSYPCLSLLTSPTPPSCLTLPLRVFPSWHLRPRLLA